MQKMRSRTVSATIVVAAWMLAIPGPAGAAPANGENGAANLFAARRLLKLGTELLDVPAEAQRGVKMLETVIEQYPDLDLRHTAHLRLGRYQLSHSEFDEALRHLRYLRELEVDGKAPVGEMREVYLEGLYLTGVTHFSQQQYPSAFPVLRKITNDYPNTVWANQAYYYIGMCHFMQRNWDKAIRNLSLVGTFIDPDSPSAEYVEAGRRFYVKVEDGDLPVLSRLGKDTHVEVVTGSGDVERIRMIPMAAGGSVYIGSIATAIGSPQQGDKVLQVTGGDSITCRYTDQNTKDGAADVSREREVRVVSTASVAFTQGTYENQAVAAFLEQPVHMVLHDVDLDASDQAESVDVQLVVRYREVKDETAAAVERVTGGEDEQGETFITRDELTVTLRELGDAPIRSGRFGGKVVVSSYQSDVPVSKTDELLTAAEGDEIVITYVDSQHIGGSSPRTVVATIEVAGTVDTRPRARQNVVTDAILRSRKNAVEGQAYLELARIFNDMGLTDGAKVKAAQGLERSDQIVREQEPVPDSLKEEGFRLKWELHIEEANYAEAIATCQVFHQLFPQSPLVDEAMMSIARIKLDVKDYRGAISIFEQVLKLNNSHAKAQAQFMIGQVLEEEAKEAAIAAKAEGREPPAGVVAGMPEPAVMAYRKVAEQYPDSEYAGRALGKLVDYYIEAEQYTQAADMLTRVFEEYPDAQFLDGMLLKAVLVSYRMGDYQKAYDRCNQLLVEYPSSQYAHDARNALERIKLKLEEPGETP